LRSITIAAAFILAVSVGCNSEQKKAEELAQQERDSVERMGLVRDKDNLGAAVAEYATMVNELDGVLRTSRDAGKEGIVDDRQRRRDLVRRARALRQSLDSMVTRINELEAEARKSGKVNESRLADIAALKATVAQLTQITDRQKGDIERMALQIDSVTKVSQANEQHAATLQVALNENVERQESVYVAIGSSKELQRTGIARKKGGVLGMGETLVPILPYKSNLFKPLRMSSDTVIEFPKSDATYRVITAQNPSGAAGEALSRLTGKLVIHDPKTFWRDTRFMVIVER
jgi:hypothetical protein